MFLELGDCTHGVYGEPSLLRFPEIILAPIELAGLRFADVGLIVTAEVDFTLLFGQGYGVYRDRYVIIFHAYAKFEIGVGPHAVLVVQAGRPHLLILVAVVLHSLHPYLIPDAELRLD